MTTRNNFRSHSIEAFERLDDEALRALNTILIAMLEYRHYRRRDPREQEPAKGKPRNRRAK